MGARAEYIIHQTQELHTAARAGSAPSSFAVRLVVYNTLGQQVAALVDGNQSAGFHEVRFDGSALASGIYFYRLQTGNFVETRELLLLR